MMRTLLIAAIFALFVAPVPAWAGDDGAVVTKKKIAKAPPKKAKGKPAEKAAPEGTRTDPRASQPSAAQTAAAEAAAAAEVGGRRGMSRIEFDDRLIQGQTNKANAIYLFERRESSLRSLLKKRTHFHEEIDETLEQ